MKSFHFCRVAVFLCKSIWKYNISLLTLLHSERPKLHTILAFLSAIELNKIVSFEQQGWGFGTKLQPLHCKNSKYWAKQVWVNSADLKKQLYQSILLTIPCTSFEQNCTGKQTADLRTATAIIFGVLIFSLPEQSSERAIALPPASALAKCLSCYVKVFLCDGQGADRRAILYIDRSCLEFLR